MCAATRPRLNLAVVSVLTTLAFTRAAAQRYDSLSPPLRQLVRVGTPRVVLEHVEIIDGTAAATQPYRNVTIENGKIAEISGGADERARDGTTLLDLRGYSITPGIVGMHDHLWFLTSPNMRPDRTWDRPGIRREMAFS